jgi:hypothetical protein
MKKNFLFHPLGGMLGSTMTSTIGSSVTSSLSSSGSSATSSVVKTALSTISGGIISGINSLFSGGKGGIKLNDLVEDPNDVALILAAHDPRVNTQSGIMYRKSSMPFVGSDWNDNISYIKIHPNYKITFYKDSNFQGASFIAFGDRTGYGCAADKGTGEILLGGDGWNDVISSFKIEKIKSSAPNWTIDLNTNTNMNQSNTKDFNNWGPPPINNIISKDWSPSPIQDNILTEVTSSTGNNFISTPKTVASNIDIKQSDYKNSMSYFGIIILVVLGIFIFKKK